MPEPTPGQRRIELYVRDGLPEPTRERGRDLTAAIERLVEDGLADSATVTTCAKRYPLADDAASVPFVSFEEWADRAGVSLTPCFGTRTCYCTESGKRQRYRVVPAFVLAVYDDDRLRAVYPHVDDRPYSVPEGIEALRERDPRERLTESVGRGAAD